VSFGIGRPKLRQGSIIPVGKSRKTAQDSPLDAHYIAALPKAEHAAPKWQAAMEALILVADLGGSTMFARAGWRTIRVNLRPPLQTSPTK
jgi:hypothetical protein